LKVFCTSSHTKPGSFSGGEKTGAELCSPYSTNSGTCVIDRRAASPPSSRYAVSIIIHIIIASRDIPFPVNILKIFLLVTSLPFQEKVQGDCKTDRSFTATSRRYIEVTMV
jgi:hypothetical protein